MLASVHYYRYGVLRKCCHARGARASWLHSSFNDRGSPMRWICFALLLCLSTGAHAYIGPGAGLNVLGSLWAVLVGIVLALFAILTCPCACCGANCAVRGTRNANTMAMKAAATDRLPALRVIGAALATLLICAGGQNAARTCPITPDRARFRWHGSQSDREADGGRQPAAFRATGPIRPLPAPGHDQSAAVAGRLGEFCHGRQSRRARHL